MSVLEDVIENEINEAYNKGLNDAWELASKITNKHWTFADVRDCFGIDINFKSGADITREIFSIPYQEALAKLEAYEKEQAEIKVGDVVKYADNEYYITYISENGNIAGTNIKSGRTIPENYEVHKSQVTKTGKHIDIQKILEQIGE